MKPDLSNALVAAKTLLGWRLMHDSPLGLTVGYIVETEAYSSDDAASHSFQGITQRTKIMFGPAGHLYVYFTYGMHHCINVVTGPKGNGQAVLIRALQPTLGQELMAARRQRTNQLELMNGPGKLTQAMGINGEHNGEMLLSQGPIRLLSGLTPKHITQTTRIGISHARDEPWRFYITDNTFVSKR